MFSPYVINGNMGKYSESKSSNYNKGSASVGVPIYPDINRRVQIPLVRDQTGA